MKYPRVPGIKFAGSPVRYGLLALALVGAPCASVLAAQTDALPEEEINAPSLKVLSPDGERKTEAIARYMEGILDEESDGPEKAFESYRRVLDLEPGFSELAIYVAHEHLRRGQASDAIAVLKDALKANPKDMNLCLAVASIYLRQLQKPDLALKYAQRALDVAPGEYAPYEAFWEIYMAQNQKSRAMQILERAAKSRNVTPQFWMQLADLTARTLINGAGNLPEQDIPRVTALFDKALEYANGDLAVMARAAEFFTASQQSDRAISIYERILKSDPDYSGVMENLALCYSRTGKVNEAITAYEKIIEKDPLKLSAYDEISELYIQKEDYSHAYQNLRKALAIDSYDPMRYEKAGRLAMEYLRKPDEAVQLFGNARMRFPSQPEFTYAWAVALGMAKRYDEAMHAFEQTIFEASSLRPGMLDSEFYCRYGEAASEAKLYAKAEEMLRKSIELDPDHASEGYNGLGYMWAERGENLEEAESMIRKALAIKPDDPAYLDSLGWVLYKRNKPKEALVELQRAAERFPNPDPVIYEHLGDAYQKAGQPAQAVLYWQKAFALDSKNKALIAKIDGNTKKVAGQQQPTSTAQTPVPPAQE